MDSFFFSGSVEAKLDEKNRFVLPQNMRLGLVENGRQDFTVAMGLGGCLAIYRRSEIERIVETFKKKQHIARFQKFFTLFFSTLHHTTCDKIGRVVLPSILKKAVGIEGEIVIAGVLNKIEIWSKEKYERTFSSFLDGEQEEGEFAKLVEEAFSLINNDSQAQPEKKKEIIELAEEALGVLDE